jgi:hypothetical protein
MSNSNDRHKNYIEVDLGISTADAESVELRFINADLHLSFIDWRDLPRQLVFRNVLAFRWQEFDENDIRNDAAYEVTESEWLARQADLQLVSSTEYAHYKLCFNAIGMLDVLASRAK